MKLFLVLCFTMSAAFASTGDVLLRCTDTAFNDLEQIIIVESTDGMTKMAEIDYQLNMTITKGLVSDLKTGVALSGWNAYSRTLVKRAAGWEIATAGTCGTSYTAVTCTERE